MCVQYIGGCSVHRGIIIIIIIITIIHVYTGDLLATAVDVMGVNVVIKY